MKNIIQEFKEFAIKGNMIDIAIGVIIGAAFNTVVDVLVKQIFMPPLAMLTNGASWENKRYILREAVLENGITKVDEIAIGYGSLMEATVDFLIISATVFLVVKLMNSLRKKADDTEDKTVTTPKNIELLNKLAELLEQQNELLRKK